MSYLLDYNPGTQQWGFPRRGGAQLSGTIIVHTAECAADNVGEDTSAEGCANMIANRADYGSYHRLVDSDSIIDMLPWEYEAWQDSETNNWAVGISAALRTSDWLTMPADRRERVYRNLAACAADFVRYMAGKGVTVPLRRINGAQARARVPGFCAHGDSGIARSDPGAAFDWDLFFRYTEDAITFGSLSYTGLITELKELGMDADQEKRVIDAIYDIHDKIINTLRPVIETVPGAVLNTTIARGGEMGGETSLGSLVSWNDQHVIQTIAAASAAASGDGATVEEIISAVKQAIAESVVKVDVSVDGVK